MRSTEMKGEEDATPNRIAKFVILNLEVDAPDGWRRRYGLGP